MGYQNDELGQGFQNRYRWTFSAWMEMSCDAIPFFFWVPM